MDNKEAIKILKQIDIRGALQEDYNALYMAIDALKEKNNKKLNIKSKLNKWCNNCELNFKDNAQIPYNCFDPLCSELKAYSKGVKDAIDFICDNIELDCMNCKFNESCEEMAECKITILKNFKKEIGEIL